jgi:hypothetical protein
MLPRAVGFASLNPPYWRPMLLKLIALIAAAIPVFLFLRKMLGARPSKLGTAWREAKKQIDLAIYIFIGIIACVVAVAAARLAWAWWTAV